MDNVPIRYLENLKTISGVKLLIYFLRNRSGKVSVKEIMEKTGLSRNSVRNGMGELVEINFLKLENNGKEYKLVEDTPDHPEWKVSTGAKKEKAIDIILDHNLYTEDINSVSVVNPNIYLTDAEIGKIANRIMKEKFAPFAGNNKPTSWFPHQMKLMKDLLVAWRTEQVLAAIEYWTIINPPANGVSSLRFFMLTDYKTKRTKLMEALDYYKAEYISRFATDDARIKMEERKKVALRKAQEEEEKSKAEREKIDTMSDDDFVQSLLGGFGKVEKGD